MSNIATKARKVGVIARVAAQQAQRHRGVSSLIRAGRVTAGHFGRILGQLWLEVTGFVFLVLAVIGAGAFFREYGKYQAGQTTSGRVMLAILFTVTFGWFGLSSFWRVKKRK
jgi:ABC-type phosphate transport system permease subunit